MPKSETTKKGKKEEQALAHLSQLVRASCIKQTLSLIVWPYNKHLINQAGGLYALVLSTDLTAFGLYSRVCTHDLGQDSPIQTFCLVNKR